MKRTCSALLVVFALFVPAAAATAQQKDDPKCQDHPMLTRMPDYFIRNCELRQFDAHDFTTGKGQKTRVEGKLTHIYYLPQRTLTSKPSQLQIFRNFENALKRAGGTLVGTEQFREIFKVTKGSQESWVEVVADNNGVYQLVIVEKAAMEQDIVGNAAAFAHDLKATGHVAVEGILFETAKSELKPESQAAIGEVAKLLKADATLKLFVVGHTDNVGAFDANLTLSQERAQSVIQSLVKTHGIEAARLKAFGNGPCAPVASNEAAEGRAKNRRVELVKQ